MTTLLKALFTYAYENRVTQIEEYRLRCRRESQKAEQAREKLKHLLSEEGQRQLEDYIEAETFMQQSELEALFRAGLTIGLELSRL